jgi:uncharacterized protein (TIGR02271 family)
VTREAKPESTAEGAERLERIEERLVGDVEAVQSGRVQIRKHVAEEPEELEVSLRHDEVDLDRRPADRPLGPNDEPIAVRGDETVILVIQERLETRKVPWVVEEIHVRRRQVSETTRVRDTLRKERWEISADGGVDIKRRE